MGAQPLERSALITLTRAEIEQLIDLPSAAEAILESYRSASLGRVNLPPVGHIVFPDQDADCHIKYGHLQGDTHFVIKIATGFPHNPGQGLPTGNGMVLVMSATTGTVTALLHDEMLLTDVRTGLGGAIASRLLARSDAKQLLVVGTGVQARWQIKSHCALLPHIERITLWGRNPDKAQLVIDELAPQLAIANATNLSDAVAQADIIVTATGATSPLIAADWVQPGTHITAVGADAPGKQELAIDLVTKADLHIADLVAQCVDHGEFAHAVAAGHIDATRLVELGLLIENPALGRTDPTQITIADLTGIAAQDIAMANAILRRL